MIQKELKSTQIITHHPCPDGLASAVLLAKKYDLANENVSYAGLNHGSVQYMADEINLILKNKPIETDLIFVDIVPPFNVLIQILQETTGNIILLDHHITAISDILANKTNRAICESYITGGRLQLYLNQNLSGVGLTSQYLLSEMSLSVPYDLIQAADLFTATADQKHIEIFELNRQQLSKKTHDYIEKIIAPIENENIRKNIFFYLVATAMDEQLKFLFAKYNMQLNNYLIEEASYLFNKLNQEGIATLLELPIPRVDGKFIDLAEIFIQQLIYQQNAIALATILPSLHSQNMDILFVEANIRQGRTFDLLLAETLAKHHRPIVAMVSDVTEETISEKNSVSLRAADERINLFTDVALKYHEQGLVVNAGGHERASALHFDREQYLQVLKNLNEARK